MDPLLLLLGGAATIEGGACAAPRAIDEAEEANEDARGSLREEGAVDDGGPGVTTV